MRTRTPHRIVLASAMALALAPATASAMPGTDERGATSTDAAGVASQQTAAYTYEIEQRGDVEADLDRFRTVVGATLEDTDGWWRAGIDLRPVDAGGDFSVVLASPQEVDDAHEVCSARYSCRVGDDVLINDERWRQGAAPWTGTLVAYRRYAVNHEVGHWLGVGHHDCPAPGDPAPVLQQQSIDLEDCRANAWPVYFEVEEVASGHGTHTRAHLPNWESSPGVVRDGAWHLREDLSGGPADHSFRFGRPHDVPVTGDFNNDGRTTPGVVRDGTWHVRNDLSGGPADHSFRFGRPDDLPVVGGGDTGAPGAFRDGRWLVRDTPSGGAAQHSFVYGRRGDTPVTW